MKAFVRHTGIAAALRMENVDTDVIMPLGPLMSVPRERLGDFAFQPLRGEDKDFVLDRDAYRASTILFAGANFGCGSSREGAVYALEGLGLRAVFSSSFGDIFQANCVNNGVLAATIDVPEDLARLMEIAEAVHGRESFRVDLEERRIIDPRGGITAFHIDPAYRERLLTGQDDIDVTLRLMDRISGFAAEHHHNTPWSRLAVDRA
jgi:3-isopropylmalate/(R)-2-methylmalate dehydratase small subunit